MDVLAITLLSLALLAIFTVVVIGKKRKSRMVLNLSEEYTQLLKKHIAFYRNLPEDQQEHFR